MARPVFHHSPHPHEHDSDPTTPGLFHQRPRSRHRDYRSRSFTVGIGGPVGSGKTALLLALCRTPARHASARRGHKRHLHEGGRGVSDAP